jgi:hypothetical protein
VLVRELGYANAAVGAAGVLSLHSPSWTVPIALVAGVFYGLAGIGHVVRGPRNRLENVAMASDLFMSALLVGYLLAR